MNRKRLRRTAESQPSKGKKPPSEVLHHGRSRRAPRWLAVGASLLVTGCEALFSTSGRYEQPPETEVLEQFDFVNSFPVDQAVMTPEAGQEVRQQLEQLFEEHDTPETFSSLAHSRVIIEVSSDERPTTSWGDLGNEALSQARLEVLDSHVREVLTQYQFSDTIPQREVDQVRRKRFTRRLPAGEWGRGVTPIRRLTNPDTGQLYTDDELTAMTSQQREHLYDQARYARVILELPGQNEPERQYGTLVEIISGYDTATLVLDRSTSMRDDYERLAKGFEGVYERHGLDVAFDTTYVVPFANDADFSDYRNVEWSGMPQYLKELRLYGARERLFFSVRQIVDKAVDNKKVDAKSKRQAIITLTDEGIQDFSATEMERLAESANEHDMDLYFGLIGNDSLITFVDHNGLIREYDDFVQSYSGPTGRPTTPEEKKEWLDGRVSGVQLDNYGNIIFTGPLIRR